MGLDELFAAMMGIDLDDCDYDEINKLDDLLTEADIPHEFLKALTGGYQVTYYGAKGKPLLKPGEIRGAGVGAVCSAILTPFSYGHENGLLEISGLLTDAEYEEDSVAGNLTAEDVFERIKNHWLSENK